MQRLEVSCAVLPIYWSLCAKGLMYNVRFLHIEAHYMEVLLYLITLTFDCTHNITPIHDFCLEIPNSTECSFQYTCLHIEWYNQYLICVISC
jgi:hypothetical protein